MKTIFCLLGGLALPVLAVSAEAQTAESVDVVQAHIDAYRAKDMDRFLATFADDAVLSTEGFEFRGKAQIRKAYALNFAANAPSVYLVDSGTRGDVVYFESGYRFANGSDICCAFSEYRVENGLITSLVVSGPG